MPRRRTGRSRGGQPGNNNALKSGLYTAEMFALRFLEGWSNGEIAEQFGVSSLVVAVTLHRARKQVQKAIGELGGLR